MNKKILIWNRLLKNKCPGCNKNLWFDGSEPMIICSSYMCGFMIDSAKMQEITMRLTSRKLEWDADLEGQNGTDFSYNPVEK